MRGRKSLCLLLAFGIAALPVPAAGQVRICRDRTTLLERFARQFDERPVGRGLMQDGGVLELLSSADGATWTLVLTQPNGRSCMIAAGQFWQAEPLGAPGDAT